ncbi:MAG: phytanoyl-CoA dioxygenase family protein [Candidatus Latescibacteria bacterium]|nr:phytanoyl-CoA dioxygenase family protein [Candidatus Latescibacterota bacterium]
MLSQEQIELYRANGYLAVEQVFNGTEVEELRRVTDEFVDKSRQVDESDAAFDLEPGHTAAAPQLRRLKSPVLLHEAYKRALHHDGLLDIVEQLVGPGVRYNGDKLNMKSGGFGSPVEWHQDWAFYPHTNDDLLAVGVCIDDMTVENGCLMVIPGSHKGKIYDHHLDGRFCGAVTEPDFDDGDAVRIEVPAGGISIHHVRALHGSLPNTTPHPRRLLLLQYCAADAYPLVGKGVGSWDDFGETFLRGDPTPNIRASDAPIRMPQPPALRGGSIYENQTVLQESTFKKVG